MIKVENLCFSYNQRQILNNLNFTLEKGKVVLLVGSNGCGKSTLLYLLSGLYSTSSGRICIDSKEYSKYPDIVRDKIGMMFQEPIGFKGSTVLEVLKFFRVLTSDVISLDQLIQLTKIKPFLHQKIDSLSGGEKQKVALAIALAGNPDYLFLDEPISALDVPSRREFLGILNELKKRGMTIVITSHILEELREISDKVLYLREKSIYCYKETERLIRELGYTHRIILSGNQHSFVEGFKHFVNENKDIVLYCRHSDEVDLVYAQNGLSGIRVDPVSLDDLFYLSGE